MTLWDYYRGRSDLAPEAPAVVDQQGVQLTHGELRKLAERASVGLDQLGIRAGGHLGVFLPNRATWPVIALAAAHRGVGIVGLNTRFRKAELNHLLKVGEVETVMVADSFLGIDGPGLMAGLDRPVVVIVDDGASDSAADAVPAGHRWHDLLSAASSADSVIEVTDSQPLIGFTTSGTTGFPKVAMHDQAQTLSHLNSVGSAFALTADSVTLVPLPFCGAFGYTAAMATLLAGGKVVLHETWDPDAAAVAIAEHGVTFASASDDMLLALAASEHFSAPTTWTDGGFADFTNSGSQAVAAVEAAGGPNIRLTGLYGSSEGFALMSSWDRALPQSGRSRNGGYLVSAEMSVRCADPETGAIVANDEPGELQFRGPNLIDRYLNNEAATAKAFTDDAWYRSGDLGYTIEPDDRGHEGFVFLARLGDTLRLRGFLCDPAEIEKHLETHPAVELAQVVGVQRPSVGDVAVAFVRLSDDPSTGASMAGSTGPEGVDEAALIEHCRAGLANYKRPERVLIVEEFPVTDGPNGVKIRKVDLRDQAAKLVADNGGQ